jgi:hypothetical protein
VIITFGSVCSYSSSQNALLMMMLTFSFSLLLDAGCFSMNRDKMIKFYILLLFFLPPQNLQSSLASFNASFSAESLRQTFNIALSGTTKFIKHFLSCFVYHTDVEKWREFILISLKHSFTSYSLDKCIYNHNEYHRI